jgi:hypothetical protein
VDVLKRDKIKIYCKFNKTKQPIDKVICKMFEDFTEKKRLNKNIEKKLTKYKYYVMMILM